MAAKQPDPSGSSSQEYIVRLANRDPKKKKYSIMKFAGSGSGVDFTNVGDAPVKMERENNLKEFKNAHNLDQHPKFGAGSEFGREQKNEARRKKYGIFIKKYNPNNQPWHLKIGQGKQAKKYKGVREGTISENTSYYIFTQSQGGVFEAVPIQEWYNFTPVIRYKYLNSEEAEEEFLRRDRTMNLFNVMLRKRLHNTDEAEPDPDEEKQPKGKGKSKKDKDFLLTEIDEWAIMSDDDDDEDDDDDNDGEKKKKDEDDDDDKNAKKKKAGPDKKGVKKNAKHNSDDEAIEDSDEGDFDDREVDYMTDSASSVSGAEDREKANKYEEKGVDEERGLKKMIDSGDEDSEEENENKDENEDMEVDENKDEKAKKEGSDSESSSSESGSDSDIEKEGLTSALFMQKKTILDKVSGSEKPRSRSATPTAHVEVDRKEKTASVISAVKRKTETEDGSSKKARTESPLPAPGSASEGITEDSVRRYLMRKPMTTKDLLQKFKSKRINLTNEQMATSIAQMLKKLNPERTRINKVLYLSIKGSHSKGS